MGPKNTTAGSSLWYKWAVGWKDFFSSNFKVLWKGKTSPMSSKFLLKVGGISAYMQSCIYRYVSVYCMLYHKCI